jgi:hypothetical protein
MTDMHTTSSVSISFFFLVLPLLAGIAGLVAMLFFKRTRPFGVVMLSLAGLLGMGIFWIRGSYHAVRVSESRSATEAADAHRIARANADYYKSVRSKNSYENRKRPADARTIDASRTEWLKSYDDDIQSFYRNVSEPGNSKAKVAPVSGSVASSPDKTATKAEAEPPAAVVAPTARLFEAMGRALSKALTETRSADKTAPSVKKPDPPVAKKADPPVVTKAAPPAVKKPDPPVVEKADPMSPRASQLPAWANQPPRMDADGATYVMPIVVGPWQTRQECDAHLPEELQKALDEYAEKCLGRSARPRIVLPADYLRQHLVFGECEEVRQTSVGPMKQLHVLLKFDDEVKRLVLAEHHRGMVVWRLWAVGMGLAVVLWPIAVIYAYLKIDLATGGAFRGRLRFALLLAILGPIAAALAVMV